MKKIRKEDSIDNVKTDKLLRDLFEPDSKEYKINVFRFILFKAYHYNVLFRIEKDLFNKITLTTKYFSVSGGVDGTELRFELVKEEKKYLTLKDWKKIKSKSLESYFWSLELYDNPRRGFDDGSFWIIEGKRIKEFPHELPNEPFKDYTRVKRKSPYKGSFFDLGLTNASIYDKFDTKKLY